MGKLATVNDNIGDTDQNNRKEQLVDLISKIYPEAKVEYVHRV